MRRADVASRLKIVLAYQPPDLLVIDDHSSMPQLRSHASPAVEFELVADRGDRLDDRGIVMRDSGKFPSVALFGRGRFSRSLGPGVPIEDVYVGAANAGLVHLTVGVGSHAIYRFIHLDPPGSLTLANF
jgi:hypothetical protein